MQVVLLERVEKLGQIGDVVKVKDGFARNYLLPKKKALRATKANLTYFETQRVQLEARNLCRAASRIFYFSLQRPRRSTLFPYTTLFRSQELDDRPHIFVADRKVL